MRVLSFSVMRLSLLVSLLLAYESNAADSKNPMKPEASGKLAQAPPQVQNQELVGKPQLTEETMDLERLRAVSPATSLPVDHQQLEPVATANHQTRVSYHEVPLNMADLMIGSNSMPEGRRRLDSESDLSFVLSDQAPLGSSEPDQLALSRETLMTAAALNWAADQRSSNMNQYEKIVDNGAGSRRDERYPRADLLTELADENHIRMALSNSQRQRQALVNKMARRQLDLGSSPLKLPRGARQQSGRQMARQQSQPRRAKSMGRTRDGDADETDNEYDELESQREPSNRDEDSASSDPEDGADADDEGADQRNPALKRRLSDPFFDEPEADERRDFANNNDKSAAFDNNEDADGDGNGSTPSPADGRHRRQMLRRQGGQQARPRPDARLRKAASQQRGGRHVIAGLQISGRHQQNTSGRGQKPHQEGELNGDIDSMNSRQQLVRASLRSAANNGQVGADFGRQPLVFNDVNSINLRGDKLADEHAPLGTSGQFNQAGADNLQGADDSDLSESHIRNSATDLQAAAGHHHDHGHYYQHVEVPKEKAWKFGFKRGNHKHTIEKHEKGYKHKFNTKFKWHAKEKCKKKSKCESVGKMTWDYKHHKKHHH